MEFQSNKRFSEELLNLIANSSPSKELAKKVTSEYKVLKEALEIEIKKELVFAIGDPKMKLVGSVAKRKATIISKLAWLGYRTFVFFDDNEANLKSAKDLEKTYNIKVVTVKV